MAPDATLAEEPLPLPLPLPALVIVTVFSIATSTYFASTAHDLDANLSALVIASCGTPTLIAGAQYLTRRSANEIVMASPVVRRLTLAFVALAAAAAAAVGGAPEDAAIGALPLIFVMGDWEAILRPAGREASR